LPSYSAATLKSHLQADPLGLGYAAKIAAGDDNALVALLNSPGSTTVTPATLDKGAFLLNVVAPAALALATKDEATKDKWDRIIRIITGAPSSISVASPVVQALLAQAVADGLLAQPTIDAATRRTATVFEGLFAAGEAATLDRVSPVTAQIRAGN
jgi:hypothetical protein